MHMSAMTVLVKGMQQQTATNQMENSMKMQIRAIQEMFVLEQDSVSSKYISCLGDVSISVGKTSEAKILPHL